MRSPFTNGTTQLKKEHRELVFRKEPFFVLYHFYVCTDTGQQFTTTELDTLNLNQVYNKYREKYGIPFTDEIINIRKKYGLSASKMSDVLGLGINSYRNYEAGEIPSVATGRLIRLASKPDEFIKLLEMSKNTFEKNHYESVFNKIQQALKAESLLKNNLLDFIYDNMYPNICNGYKVPSLERICSMINFFAKRNQPFTTALNKLMFYADFGHFKKTGVSISGIYYKALQHGPVPESYGFLYCQAVNSGYAKSVESDFGEYVGERFFADDENNFDSNSFLDSEIEILEMVSKTFMSMNTKAIVQLSHKEPAWVDNVDEKNRISYEYSFELVGI